MLVLSRKIGERVLIEISGEKLWISVVEIDRGKVRLGFQGTKSISIFREELLPAAEQRQPESA